MTIVGRELPLFSTDAIEWFTLSVSSTSVTQSPEISAPATRDASSICVVGDEYFIWRINETTPNVLEIVEFNTSSEPPRVGLRIEFPSGLCPFAKICRDEYSSSSSNPYLLYTMTVSGVAYLIRLKGVTNYGTSSVIPPHEAVVLNPQNFGVRGVITHIAAIAGFLIIGQPDGSIVCFRLGSLDVTSPGFLHELRDDSFAASFTSLVSRRTLAPVTDLICSEIRGRKHVFVLHRDGLLQVWDILRSHRLLNSDLDMSLWSKGATYMRLWPGDVYFGSCILPLAIMHRPNPQVDGEMISLYSLHLGEPGLINYVVKPSRYIDFSTKESELNITVEEGAVIDVKLSSYELWILKQNGLELHNLAGPSESWKNEQVFGLQELVISKELFQSSEHATDDLFLLAHSLYPSPQEQVATHVSSIFLRLLFLPGIFYHSVLRLTLQDHNVHFTESEFHSFTADGMKKEIISVIENEAASRSPLSLLHFWKNFCSRYIDHWCRKNAPCGLLLDSITGAALLIRKSSVSLFRHLEEIEISCGSFTTRGENASKEINLPGDLDRELLSMALQCSNNISRQLGNGAPALFHDSFYTEQSTFHEDISRHLLKVLQSGTSDSIATLYGSNVDTWKKRVEYNTLFRIFSTDMWVSLQSMYTRAGTWDKVIDVIILYCTSLIPPMYEHRSDCETIFGVRTAITSRVSSQISKVMFESVVDILVLSNYMVNIGGMINMLPADISRVQLELFPFLQEILSEWHIVHFIGTTPCEAPLLDILSSQLSLSEINTSANQRSWNGREGNCDLTLASVLMLDDQRPFQEHDVVHIRHLPTPNSISSLLWKFSSWIVSGTSIDASSSFATRATMLALILLKHGQFKAVEHILTTTKQNLLKEKISHDIQGDWCITVHLLGCCSAAQAHRDAAQTCTQKKLDEAISCFFRAASFHGASSSLQKLSSASGLWHLPMSGQVSPKAWTIYYYQWVMQLFEHYNMSAGARQFAVAALEQIDEVLGIEDRYSEPDFETESPVLMKGRLWVNVFKFSLDLNNYSDAYCAIIMNPNEESKGVCLRHLIDVLFERHEIKILCDGSLPFAGLAEKVEHELALKAKRSDVSVEPNPYKVLYAFAVHQCKWRKAASSMYLYSRKLKREAAGRGQEFRSFALQERLNCLSAAINALYLLSTNSACISTSHPDGNDNLSSENTDSCIDIEKLEKEFVLTSAEHILWKNNIEWSFSGIERPPSNLIELLVQLNLYDMSFSVLLRFYRGSTLKGELERVFSAMSRKCCLSRDDTQTHSRGTDQWDELEQHVGTYKSVHPRLPVIVAEAILSANSLMTLPRWLVEMFKGTLEGTWGMAGSESSPALLFQLYVDYGRYAEATSMVLHYLQSVASLRPEDVIHRKKPSSMWFPYTTIERLKSKLGESISSGQMVAECEEQRSLLEAALLEHFQMLEIDLHDVMEMSVATSSNSH